MKSIITLFFLLILSSSSIFSQKKTITHKVIVGETVYQIAQKYNITTGAIIQLNPDAASGLKPNSVLIIPNKNSKTSQTFTHKVVPKETIYSITKEYNISDGDLKKANPTIEKEGLQIGQILVIPFKNSTEPTEVKPVEKTIYHEVLPKETKYSIAKQYGITVEELEKKNPEIVANLPVGYKLLVKGTALKPTETATTKSVDGNEVVIRKPEESQKSISKLSKKSNTKKNLDLLLPFNISKIENDTINSTATRLKKDKFLNMTLDFYSGALIAIDSAKVLGLPVDVRFFDSQETKNTSNITVIIQENNFENTDAVIGPFYQNNVEKTAEMLSKTNIPVISPLSREIDKSFPNLYQTIVPNVVLRNTMFDYMRGKNGNIIAVVDKKKVSIRQYIQDNQKDVQFATLTETGGLLAADLKKLFVPEKMNYVVLETGNTSMIKTTLATMIGAMKTYKVQLVVLEQNETLDTDEINFSSLTKLKMMYPSMSRENESDEALIFEKNYRKKNKIYPNTFATRGFDITFDTMMRLSQDKTYHETAETTVTEQVDNKFEFYKNENGVYANKAVYILYYDIDLHIKEAN